MYFPFPVLNGAENNMVGFALKENDSFSCVQHLVSQRCVYLSNGTVFRISVSFSFLLGKMLFMTLYRNF